MTKVTARAAGIRFWRVRPGVEVSAIVLARTTHVVWTLLIAGVQLPLRRDQARRVLRWEVRR